MYSSSESHSNEGNGPSNNSKFLLTNNNSNCLSHNNSALQKVQSN